VDGPHLPILPQLLSTTQLQKVITPHAFGRIAERQVLQYLDYNLGVVTPWMVAHHWMENVMSATQNESNVSQTLKWTAFFCGLALQEYEFQRYRPTELAAAICLATGVVLRQEPEWCSSLIQITDLDVCYVTPIFFHLWSYFEERFPEYAAEITDSLL
jgi:Cyclin, C-terminal domain